MLSLLAPPPLADDAIVHNGTSQAAAYLGVTNATGRTVADLTSWYPECGYSALPVRSQVSPMPGDLSAQGLRREDRQSSSAHLLAVCLNGPLTWSLGSCEEYAAHSNHTMPVPFFSPHDLFVDTPTASFCGSGTAGAALWCDFVIVLLLLAFLVYQRWLVRRVAIDEDKSTWTTADYTVLIRGACEAMRVRLAATARSHARARVVHASARCAHARSLCA